MSITYIVITIMLLTIAALSHRTFYLSRKSQLTGVYNFNLKAERILDRAAEQVGAANGALLNLHNGGGDMVVGTPLYSSIVTEAPQKDKYASKKQWLAMPIDEHYWELMARLRAEKVKLITLDEMPSASLLRGVYEGKGYVAAYLIEVYDPLRTRYFYASFPFTHNPLLREKYAEDVMTMRYAANELRVLCEKNAARGYIK